jgi:hypothetical protein
MKYSIKHYLMLMGLVLLFTQCQKEAFDPGLVSERDVLKTGEVTEACEVVQDLWAGAGRNDTSKGVLVGSVKASVSGSTLTVTYNLNDYWVLTEAHVWVGKNKYDIPRNAAPGQFPFKKDVDHAKVVTFEIDLNKLGIAPGDPIYVAAHGVAKGVDGLASDIKMLPVEIVYKVTFFKSFPGYPATAPHSYFKIDIEDGFWSGNYSAWCLDASVRMSLNKFIAGKAYSSYGDLPENLFKYTDNLPAVNWLINNIKVADGKYTMGDIQRAIWVLLAGDPFEEVEGGVGPYDLDRVYEIVSKALAYGAKFVPVCGQKMIIIIVAPNEQTTGIEITIPCGGKTETVWAHGQYTFSGLSIANKWGWMFAFKCEE